MQKQVAAHDAQISMLTDQAAKNKEHGLITAGLTHKVAALQDKEQRREHGAS